MPETTTAGDYRQEYSDPARETDPHAMPDVALHHWPDAMTAETDGETVTLPDWDSWGPDHVRDALLNGAECIELQRAGGWYWAQQFPGCLPDGEWSGPFDTWREALEDARGDLAD